MSCSLFFLSIFFCSFNIFFLSNSASTMSWVSVWLHQCAWDRYLTGFLYFTGINFVLTFVAAILCVCFAPTAAGPGIPEIKAYLNGVDTPNMFGATTLIVKVTLIIWLYATLSQFLHLNYFWLNSQQTSLKGIKLSYKDSFWWDQEF